MQDKKFNINKLFFYWLFFLFFFVVYYLFKKHSVGNDTSVSEWLINYSGGFTRRGLGGEITTFISSLFNIKLRLAIFFIQVFFHLIYFLILYLYVKNLRLNILQLFALFSPIFVLHPVADIETLGRKEIILFCYFLLIVFFSDKRFSKIINNLLIIFVLPLIILIWEEIVLFCPFILSVLIFSREQKNLKEIILNNFFLFIPAILTFAYLYLNPLDKNGHEEMCAYLMINFGERCYMSTDMLITHTIYFDTFADFHKNAHLGHYLRYLFIFLIGFLPMHLQLIKNSFMNSDNFIFQNLKPIQLFFLMYIPITLLFIFALDWGRWITISYNFSFIFYLFLIRNNYISQNLFSNNFLNQRIYPKKKLLIFIFLIFSFSWNQKSTITEDIGSFPVYRIVQKAVKWSILN